VDLRALRNNRVALVERGAPHSLCLVESGKLLPGVKVVIANPDTKGQCGDSHLGEIWVRSFFFYFTLKQFLMFCFRFPQQGTITSQFKRIFHNLR
jgi:hypothetical protein